MSLVGYSSWARKESDTTERLSINYVASWRGGEFGGEWIHVYVWLRPFPKKGNAEVCSNYHTVVVLISHASKVMFKILQARLQHELPDVQPGFRKGRGTRDQVVNICWIIEKAREF